jgi:hypothetical protein
MKTMPETLALINTKMSFHKNQIDKITEELRDLRSKGMPQTDEMKLKLMQYVMVIAEHKGIINTLSTLFKEIQE